MFGWLGKVFGTDKALGGIVDSVSSGLDKLNFSDQEKAEMNVKMQDHIVKWLEASQGQNLARRYIAFGVAGVWLLQYVVSMCMSVAAGWVEPNTGSKLLESAAVIGDYASGMNGAMMLILGFYFAAPHIGQIVGPAMEKFSKGRTGK